MFPDGEVQQYAANTIADNIYFQVDEEVIDINLWITSSIKNHMAEHCQRVKSLRYQETETELVKKLPKDGTWRYNGRVGKNHELHCERCSNYTEYK